MKKMHKNSILVPGNLKPTRTNVEFMKLKTIETS